MIQPRASRGQGRGTPWRVAALLAILLWSPLAGASDDTLAPDALSTVAANPASEELNRTADALAARVPAVATLARAHPRVSQIIGAGLDGAGDVTLGRIIDVMLRDEGGPLAILRLAGGGESALVAVPTSQLRWADGRLAWPGMTAEDLRGHPVFRFDSAAAR